jgi:hypothetical protein
VETTIKKWLLSYTIMAILSMIASLIVAGTIFNYKKLQEHPNLLIAYLSIANFMSVWALLIYIVGTPDFVCYFGIANLYHWTISFLNPQFTLIESIKTLCFSNILIFDVF